MDVIVAAAIIVIVRGPCPQITPPAPILGSTSLGIKSLSEIFCMQSHLSGVWLFATPWAIACQAPLSVGFSRQEYWSGLPFSFSRGIFLIQGSNSSLLSLLHWQAGSLPLSEVQGFNEIVGLTTPSVQEQSLLEWTGQSEVPSVSQRNSMCDIPELVPSATSGGNPLANHM